MATKCRKAEVLIVGGGVSGVAAAVAAARSGCDTLLVERYGFLGGMFTGGNMTVLNCRPISGVGKELIDALMTAGNARMCPDDPPNYPVFHYASEYSTLNVLYDAEAAKLLVMSLVKDAGVRTLLHSFALDVIADRNRVCGIEVCNKGGRETILADVVIDATSDADVAARAGIPFRKGQGADKTLFAVTLMVKLRSVDWKEVSEYSSSDPGFGSAIADAVKAGELPYYKPRERSMANYCGHSHPELSHLLESDEALLWGGTVEGIDGTRADDLTRAEFEVREQFQSELAFLRKRVPGFSKARVASTGIHAGIRDTRHVVGLQTLTPEDILEQKKYESAVAYNLKGGVPVNDIQYGCLVPSGFDGILVSGNAISVIPGSTQMGIHLGSFNNVKDIPSMWTTGQAAGCAASVCVRNGRQPAQANVKEIQQLLQEQGAIPEPEKVKETEQQPLPSGKTFHEFYATMLSEMKEYWQNRGEYSP